MKNTDKKINLSNKIYPFYFGFSSDIMFWAAINTLFLTTVKKFSAAQINSLAFFSVTIVLLTYFLVLKIIKKIGNMNSVKLGSFMLLIATLFITFSKHYFGVLIGYIFYVSAFLFKCMDTVALRKNLKYQNRVDDYIKYQNNSTLIYSLNTFFYFINFWFFI